MKIKIRTSPSRSWASESVLFVPHTPDSILKRGMMEVDNFVMGKKRTGRVKVVKTLGKKLTEAISNPAPWSKQHCVRKDCPPCSSKPGSCSSRNLTHSIKCLECGNIYWGESHRPFHDRAMEHLRAISSPEREIPLVQFTHRYRPKSASRGCLVPSVK